MIGATNLEDSASFHRFSLSQWRTIFNQTVIRLSHYSTDVYHTNWCLLKLILFHMLPYKLMANCWFNFVVQIYAREAILSTQIGCAPCTRSNLFISHIYTICVRHTVCSVEVGYPIIGIGGTGSGCQPGSGAADRGRDGNTLNAPDSGLYASSF